MIIQARGWNLQTIISLLVLYYEVGWVPTTQFHEMDVLCVCYDRE